jgi:hypothetical protein
MGEFVQLLKFLAYVIVFLVLVVVLLRVVAMV